MKICIDVTCCNVNIYDIYFIDTMNRKYCHQGLIEPFQMNRSFNELYIMIIS